MSGSTPIRFYSAERPEVGARVHSCMGCKTPGVTVAEVTDAPVTELQRRGTVVRYYGVRLSSGPWVSAADCVLYRRTDMRGASLEGEVVGRHD